MIQQEIKNNWFSVSLALLFSVSLALLPSVGQAARLLLETPRTVAVGDSLAVALSLDPEGQNVNSVEGMLRFPRSLFELTSISDGGSVISLWVERPHLAGEGLISFAGVIPGGFAGVLSPYYPGPRPGKLWQAVFKVKAAGRGSFSLEGARVLQHDGLGTEAVVRVERQEISISGARGAPAGETEVTVDTVPPELFKPELGKSENIFNSQWFVAFTAQDKDSGLDYYEVQETKDAKPAPSGWVKAASPYLLKDQSLASFIYVKAVDRTGNTQLVVLPPQQVTRWYANYLDWAIIILVLVICFVSWRYYFRHRQ